jgi:hypothetical protein
MENALKFSTSESVGGDKKEVWNEGEDFSCLMKYVTNLSLITRAIDTEW